MSEPSWRTRSYEVLSKLAITLPKDATPATVDAAIRDAYPFGTRENYPYVIWCDEVKRFRQALEGKPVKGQTRTVEAEMKSARMSKFAPLPGWDAAKP